MPHFTPAAVSAVSAAVCLAAASVASAQVDPVVIVRDGRPAADGNGDLFLFGRPIINDAGVVAVDSDLIDTDGGFADNDGFFGFDARNGDDLAGDRVFVREGQIGPFPGTIYSTVDTDPALDPLGRLVFYANFQNNPVTNRALVVAPGGGVLEPIVAAGDAAPDGNGVFDLNLAEPVRVNAAGQVAFRTSLADTAGGTADDRGVFLASTVGGKSLTTVAREGDPAPGGGTYGTVGIVLLNDAGQVGFRSDLAGGAALFVTGPGGTGPQRVFTEGDAVPGGNGTFDDAIGGADLTPDGTVVFQGRINGAGSASDRGLFAGRPGEVVELAREGLTAPGGNGTFRDFNDLLANDTGTAIFRGVLTDTDGGTSDNSGIYTLDYTSDDPQDTLVQVAREGEASPDGDGVYGFFRAPAVNDAGQIAFGVQLRDGADGVTDDAIVAGAAGELFVVAREGESFLGSTIVDLGFAIEENSANFSGFNDAGEVAYSFILADGRAGLAVATIPEPAALGLAAAAGLLLTRRR